MTTPDQTASWSVGTSTEWRDGKPTTRVTLSVDKYTLGVCPDNAEFIAQQLLLAAKAVRETRIEEEAT